MTTASSGAATDLGISADRTGLRRAWADERAAAAKARTDGDSASEWTHLERAHILSQPMAGPHVRTHVDMLGYGIRHRDGREILGQMFRMLVAAPGSWTGKYPVGNTGAASVSAFAPMTVPEDLRTLLEAQDKEEGR